MSDHKLFDPEEVARLIGVKSNIIIEFVHREWIQPESEKFDEEDVARTKLIYELQENFGVNDEAISIILNLVDQLHYLRNQIGRLGD